MRAAATAPVGGDFARKGGVPGIKGWDAGGRDAEVDFEAWERGNGQWVDGKGGGKGGGGGEGDLHRHIQFGMLAPGEAVSGDLVMGVGFGMGAYRSRRPIRFLRLELFARCSKRRCWRGWLVRIVSSDTVSKGWLESIHYSKTHEHAETDLPL